jgi:uncharacterized membrane protein YczE
VQKNYYYAIILYCSWQAKKCQSVAGGIFIKQYTIRILRLFIGLFLYALGIVITIRANIGYAPWDVFHAGLAWTVGISLGLASILVGLVLLIVVSLFREKLGLGTLMNIVAIGIFIDMILALGIIPLAEEPVTGGTMLVAGLFTIAFASYFYIDSGFGAGPRDSLMVALTRLTKKPVGACRAAIEVTAVACGWFLGGMVGVGTIASAFGIGMCVQVTFRLLKFDSTAVEHETLDQTGKRLIGAIRKLMGKAD